MRPSDCHQCKEIFLSRPMLMAEMTHLASAMGVGVAEAELNERLQADHDEYHQEERHDVRR